MFSKQHRIWSFHVVVLQRTAKKCTKNYQCPCTAIVLLFKSIFGGVLVTVAVVFCVRSLLTSRTSSPCDWYYVNMFRIWQKLNKANENSLKLCSRVYNLVPYLTFVGNDKTKSRRFNSSSLKSVFEKLCFRDGLEWTVGLTVEIKVRFQIPLAKCECCMPKSAC